MSDNNEDYNAHDNEKIKTNLDNDNNKDNVHENDICIAYNESFEDKINGVRQSNNINFKVEEIINL